MSLAEFQKLHDEMRSLKNGKKHEEFAARFVAKDATFMAPFHDPVHRDGLAKLAKEEKMETMMKSDIETKLDEITTIGDVVIDRSTFKIKTPNGEKAGWNLTVWVKEDGKWKIRNTCTTIKA